MWNTHIKITTRLSFQNLDQKRFLEFKINCPHSLVYVKFTGSTESEQFILNLITFLIQILKHYDFYSPLSTIRKQILSRVCGSDPPLPMANLAGHNLG